MDLLWCEPHQLFGLLHRALPGDGQPLQPLLLTPLLQVDRVGRRKLTLLSYLGIVLSLLLLGIGFTLAEVKSPAVTVQVSQLFVTIFLYNAVCEAGDGTGPCGEFTSCSDCTWEYDTQPGGEDLNCGFCFRNHTNIPSKVV